jgi:CubicO group peptidase (beta-lactamase class C family)
MGGSILNEHTFWRYKDHLRTTADWLARVAELPLERSPGTAWSYSNAGFVVLGAVIEQTTSQSYFDYLRAHIWHPLRMQDTDGYALDEDVAQRAMGYMEREDGADLSQPRRNNLPYSLIRGSAHGGGYSTVPDLLRFATALRQHTLLSTRATELLLTSKVATGRKADEYYAYGFFVEQVQGHHVVGHGGMVAGFNAWFDLYWDAGYTVVILANYAAPAAQDVGQKVRQLLPHALA